MLYIHYTSLLCFRINTFHFCIRIMRIKPHSKLCRWLNPLLFGLEDNSLIRDIENSFVLNQFGTLYQFSYTHVISCSLKQSWNRMSYMTVSLFRLLFHLLCRLGSYILICADRLHKLFFHFNTTPDFLWIRQCFLQIYWQIRTQMIFTHTDRF